LLVYHHNGEKMRSRNKYNNNNSSNVSISNNNPHQPVTLDKSPLQNQKRIKTAVNIPKPRPFKRVLIVDDHSDTAITFKVALE
jgi:hypothetical protein